MRMIQPGSNNVYIVGPAPEWPAIGFTTDAGGPHLWQWTVVWGSFQASGEARTSGNTWDAGPAIRNCGGVLTVRAAAGQESASVSARVAGTNPGAGEVAAYLAAQPGSEGFGRILQRETGCRHFNSEGDPLRSFDLGYGICQLTTPAPSFDQVWNWQRNLDAGLKLFAAKRAAAAQYLSRNRRSYTPEQLTYEAVCRWNGGCYHVWDEDADAWVRNPQILRDSRTGNIGWDLTDPDNQDKTEAELHQRDCAQYSRPPARDAHWNYFGVCYADSILG
ncbi:MAG: hypothetical protein ACLQVN_06335 [Bryobacteraceae bacterium]